MHLAFGKINTTYATSRLFFYLLNEEEWKKNICQYFKDFFFFLARVLCGILKGFREEAKQRLAGFIARKPLISAAIRCDIQPNH